MSKASQRGLAAQLRIHRRVAARVGTAALLTAAAVTLAACSPAIQLDGHEVDSKVPFLSQIEDQWRNDLGAGTVSTADGAHCWLARSEKTKEFDRQAFCGPVRHLETPDAGVWDVYSFEATVSGESVTVDAIALKDTAAKFPSDRQPYRPDGAEIPANADQLAAPKAPPLDRGHVSRAGAEQNIEVKDRAKPKDGRLIAPNLEVAVTEVGRVDTITTDSGIMGPAEGEELRTITVSLKPEATWSSGQKIDTTPAFSVQTAAGKKALELTGEGFGSGTLPKDPVTIVAGVPVGQDAQLVVGVAGVDQTLSIRTGERTSKTAAAYYRSSNTVVLNKQYAPALVVNGDFEVRHGFTVERADIVPFTQATGWAKPGKLWLQLNVRDVVFGTTGSKKWQYNTPVVDVSKSIVFTDDRGQRIPYDGALPMVEDSYLTERTMAVEIPERTRSIRVDYAPNGTFSVNQFGFEIKDTKPKNGVYKFPRLAFTVTIPQT